MNLFFIVFPAMLLLVAAMAVGVIFGRKPIAGTCGGLNNMVGGGTCEICGGNPQRCDAQDDAEAGPGLDRPSPDSALVQDASAQDAIAYDATHGAPRDAGRS